MQETANAGIPVAPKIVATMKASNIEMRLCPLLRLTTFDERYCPELLDGGMPADPLSPI
jgi:hypothetical protein